MPDSSSAATVSKDEGEKPLKPYPEFPLYSHPLGYWSKKIDGKIRHFGRWGRIKKGAMKVADQPEDGWEAALIKYHKEVSGEIIGPQAEPGLTLRELCNRFHTAKKHLFDSGEIAARTLAEYNSTTDRLITEFGKDRRVEDLTPADFESLRAKVAKTWGPVALGNFIQRVRSVFKLGYDDGLLDKPIRYGQSFKKPSRKVLRKNKASTTQKIFAAAEVRAMLGKATQPLKAMIFLGINCGFGNSDCGNLPTSKVNPKSNLLHFPRPKTGIARRCPLWPETVEALKAALAERPKPKDEAYADLFFVTKYGQPWAKDTPDSPITKEMAKLLDEVGAHRSGLGFYALRHTFRTVADGCRDFPAIDLIMGHADTSMGGNYREQIDNARLEAVVAHVHAWLFPKQEGGAA